MSKVGAYIHAKPDMTPFYVGKGTPKRMRDFYTSRNNYHKHILDKYGRDGVQTVFIECSDNTTALELEVGLIKCLRNMGHELANFTDGGDVGAEGYKWTDEQRAEYSKRRTGMVFSEEHKQNISAALKGKPKGKRSKEHNDKIGSMIKGRRWYNNGENVVFCHEGNQPNGYVLGRGSTKFKSIGGSK